MFGELTCPVSAQELTVGRHLTIFICSFCIQITQLALIFLGHVTDISDVFSNWNN